MDMMTEKQLSKVLQVTRQTLRNWREAGFGPTFFKFGRIVRYHNDEVERFLRQNASELTSRRYLNRQPLQQEK